MGGLDHTSLFMSYKENNILSIFFRYNDYAYQKIFPNLEYARITSPKNPISNGNTKITRNGFPWVKD